VGAHLTTAQKERPGIGGSTEKKRIAMEERGKGQALGHRSGKAKGRTWGVPANAKLIGGEKRKAPVGKKVRKG